MTGKLLWHNYAVLFRCLFSVHAWMRWLLIVGGIVFLLCVPLYMVWGNAIGLVVGGAILSMYIFLNSVSLPYQMLSIASSKQVGLLPNIRQACFWMFLFSCTIVSGPIAILIHLSQKSEIINSYLSVFILVSALLMLNMIVGQKFPRLQGLIFLCFWALPHVYKLLVKVNLIQLAIFCFSVWFAFYRHWLAWRPQKYHPNIFGMSQNQWIEFNKLGGLAAWQLSKLFSDKSNTLAGSLFLGRPDGWKSRLIGAVGVLAGLVILIGLFFAVSDVENFSRFMVFAGHVNIYIIYFSFACGVLLNIFRNVNKVWLYFSGRREDLFLFLERSFYFSAMSYGFPILLVHACVDFMLLDWSMYRELVWITLMYALIVIFVTFYAQLIIYHKTKASVRWSGWINILVMLISIVPVIACNVLWVEQKGNIIQLAGYLFGASIFGIFMLRNWVKRVWRLADLVRIKS